MIDTVCANKSLKKTDMKDQSHDIETLHKNNNFHLAVKYQHTNGSSNQTILQLTDMNLQQDKLNGQIIKVIKTWTDVHAP